MKLTPPLWLASRSPRRLQMLEAAGFRVRVQEPDFDDGALQRGNCSPSEWVTALATLKAWRVSDLVRHLGDSLATGLQAWRIDHGSVIGADTMCIHRGKAFGQPKHIEHARSMLDAMRNAEHHTMTGVCIIDLATGARNSFCDVTTVRIGHLHDDAIDRYLATGDWRGKAGAYNLSERIDDGWPIDVIGDPTTVMGLPMRRLQQMFASNALP